MAAGLRKWRRSLATLVLAASMPIASGVLSAEAWFVTEVGGTVLVLEDGRWSELPVGKVVGLGVPVRTLQSGRVTLTSNGTRLDLAPGTALQIDQAGSTTVVTQFAGAVSINADIGVGSHLVLETPSMSMTANPGYSALRIDGDTGKVEVDAGVVMFHDHGTGAQKQVAAGEGAVVSAAANLPGPAVRGSKGSGKEGSNAKRGGNSGAGEHGNGNGGNAGGNGSAGGSSNGNHRKD